MTTTKADRLEDVRWRLARSYCGVHKRIGTPHNDISWLIAEVERLRQKLQTSASFPPHYEKPGAAEEPPQ